jgi:hypothetical protein
MIDENQHKSADQHFGGLIWKYGVEPDIAEIVKLLTEIGVYVEMGCQGHSNVPGFEYPCVYFHTKNLDLAYRIHLKLITSSFWCLAAFFSPNNELVSQNERWAQGDLRFWIKLRNLDFGNKRIDQINDLKKSLIDLKNELVGAGVSLS